MFGEKFFRILFQIEKLRFADLTIEHIILDQFSVALFDAPHTGLGAAAVDAMCACTDSALFAAGKFTTQFIANGAFIAMLPDATHFDFVPQTRMSMVKRVPGTATEISAADAIVPLVDFVPLCGQQNPDSKTNL